MKLPNQGPQPFTDPKPPVYYDCGICGHFHPVNWVGDCRDDANRFSYDQLDAKYGADGYEIVDMDEADGYAAKQEGGNK